MLTVKYVNKNSMINSHAGKLLLEMNIQHNILLFIHEKKTIKI